ncbi:MAG: DNA ligase D, partial [Pseudomonadota bacterium]|nr:DNA ligase D [Pseudomonadota bacterium]
GVGSGFDEKTLAALAKTLLAMGRDTSPFEPKPRGVKRHWVEPRLVAEVSFGEWTPDGHVRHAVFHALRDDKDPGTIIREQPAPTRAVAAGAKQESESIAPAAKRRSAGATAARAAPAATTPPAAKTTGKRASADASVEGIRISHPERVIDASTGLTKLDVVNYYLEASRLILPHLIKRPVSMVRAPAGISGQLFFQRHAETLKIPELRQLDPKISPDHAAMVEIDSFTALIGAAQANVIELHTWNATTRDMTRPDRMIFDLDPGEGVSWQAIQEGTELMHALLDELGLASFLKTSGGKGLHVVVPIAAKEDWDAVKAFSKVVVEHLAAVIPDRFVAKSGPKNRIGRIFVDYLRNGFGATTACAWSVRARPGLGVSVPCAWEELKGLSGGAHWSVGNVHERIEERLDPWAGYAAAAKQTLAAARKRLASVVAA